MNNNMMLSFLIVISFLTINFSFISGVDYVPLLFFVYFVFFSISWKSFLFLFFLILSYMLFIFFNFDLFQKNFYIYDHIRFWVFGFFVVFLGFLVFKMESLYFSSKILLILFFIFS